ncbi:MAG: DUF4261 domain-containing protein [Pseudomonadota bacterium]
MSSEAGNDTAGSAIAMLALPGLVVPQPAELASFLQAEAVGQVDFNVEADAPDTLVLKLGEGYGFITHVDAPIPRDELQLPIDSAWWWAEAGATIDTHTAHQVVGVFGQPGDALATRLLLTRLLRAAAQVSGAAAVFWSEGGVLRATEDFLLLSSDVSPQAIQSQLWVNALIEPDPESPVDRPPEEPALMALTRGLAPFNAADIQTRLAPVSPNQLFDTLHNLATYLIVRREKIADGDTIGHDEGERITVRHQPNLRDPEQIAYQLVW